MSLNFRLSGRFWYWSQVWGVLLCFPRSVSLAILRPSSRRTIQYEACVNGTILKTTIRKLCQGPLARFASPPQFQFPRPGGLHAAKDAGDFSSSYPSCINEMSRLFVCATVFNNKLTKFPFKLFTSLNYRSWTVIMRIGTSGSNLYSVFCPPILKPAVSKSVLRVSTQLILVKTKPIYTKKTPVEDSFARLLRGTRRHQVHDERGLGTDSLSTPTPTYQIRRLYSLRWPLAVMHVFW